MYTLAGAQRILSPGAASSVPKRAKGYSISPFRILLSHFPEQQLNKMRRKQVALFIHPEELVEILRFAYGRGFSRAVSAVVSN
jgi:hypothetical protein